MAREQFLESQEDMDWLRDVHKVNILGYVCAIIIGNEDWPEEIQLYPKNDYKIKPTIYKPNEEGTMVLQQLGHRMKW